MKYIFITSLFLTPTILFSQQPDSAITLENITIRAFESRTNISRIPAAVSYIGLAQLKRFNSNSVVSAINATPGVRMEERSPGSYRVNIRGSSLRSPFGVRNVKVYLNDIPYTDPGGNTYLNQLGFHNFQSIEIIRGPGSSLYGAGTGGVMLINSFPPPEVNGLRAGYSTGSFNTHHAHARLVSGGKVSNSLDFQHLQSDGYRDHSELKRQVACWTMNSSGGRLKIKTNVLLGDLFYETPGALTRSEYDNNPRASRPAIFPFPSAVDARAAIHQRMALAGITLESKISSKWNQATSIYGVYSELKNPTFRNYGYANEPHLGGRSTWSLITNSNQTKMSWSSGIEWQRSFTRFKSYTNKNGNADQPISDDKIRNRQLLLFSQLQLEFPSSWIMTAGLSLNHLRVNVNRLYPSRQQFGRNYSSIIAPRLAVLRKLNYLTIYAAIARGFSPPTIAEILPSSNVINTDLDAEIGNNYEIGSRWNDASRKFYVDVNFFYLQLRNTIVQRRDATGGDYFVNAGSTDQKGAELMMQYRLINTERNNVLLRTAYTWHRFRYNEFTQLNNDYSGNEMPSVSPHNLVIGADVSAGNFYLNLNYQFTDRIFLNDANSEAAEDFSLVDARMGYVFGRAGWGMEFFVSGNNLLDEKYSLGNDINGFGGRYYNAAAGRNFMVGIEMSF